MKAMLDALREALIEGEVSGVVEDFDPETFIANLNKSQVLLLKTYRTTN